MYYVVGLGNPGEKYERTRHNVGWIILDVVREQFSFSSLHESGANSGRVAEGSIGGVEATALYPGTFMNNSGSAVKKLVPKGEESKLIVIHDDIDLPFGEIKIGQGKGAGGNNGVQSIIEALGTKDFVRLRIGIAPTSFWTKEVKRPKGGGPLERFVLKSFSKKEEQQLVEISKQATAALETIMTKGVTEAMNKFH